MIFGKIGLVVAIKSDLSGNYNDNLIFSPESWWQRRPQGWQSLPIDLPTPTPSWKPNAQSLKKTYFKYKDFFFSLHNTEARARCQESDNRFVTASWMASYKAAAIQELGGLVINPGLRGCPK